MLQHKLAVSRGQFMYIDKLELMCRVSVRRVGLRVRRSSVRALENLDHYQRYEVWVTAVTGAGQGAPSRTLLFKPRKNSEWRTGSQQKQQQRRHSEVGVT